MLVKKYASIFFYYTFFLFFFIYDVNKIILLNLYNKIHNYLYNKYVASYTEKLYNDFFTRIPNNSLILDIGIGNGTSILTKSNIDLIKEKNLKIIGVDINKNYLQILNEKIKILELEKNIKTFNINLFNIEQIEILKIYEFNYVFFSNSYPVIPNADKLVEILNEHIKYNNLSIALTLFERDNNILKKIKPFIKYIFFGIDFGKYYNVTNFEKEIKQKIISKNIIIQNKYIIFGNINIYTYFFSNKN